MSPYEIHQRRDGSIDYTRYHAAPTFLLMPAIRFLEKTAALVAAWIITAFASAVAIARRPPHADGWWRF